jgi:hypothetical protein
MALHYIKTVSLMISLVFLLTSCGGSSDSTKIDPEVSGDTPQIPDKITLADGTVVDSAEVTLTSLGTAVISAIASSNTSIVVSYSTPMSESVEDINNYAIGQKNVNTEVGKLLIYDAVFKAESNNLSVVLTTSPQNEVFYQLRVSGVNNSSGESLLTSIELASNQADAINTIFAGVPPELVDVTVLSNSSGDIVGWVDRNDNQVVDAGDSISDSSGRNIVLNDFDGDLIVDNWVDNDGSGDVSATDIVSGFQDSDGDGLSDSEELYGMTAVIQLSNGDEKSVSATSDPTKADTDGDGLSDFEEFAMLTNPRDADTDNDGISDYIEDNLVYSSPLMQDSDLDGLSDGEEHTFYHTSPLLADSDGDQLSDYTELFELNRSPRIADIPRVSIRVGDMRLQLDERYSYTDENGTTVTQESSSSTTLANSQNTSFSQSNGGVSEVTGFLSVRAGVGSGAFFGGDGLVAGGVEATGGFSKTDSTSWQTDSSSAIESQKTYDNSVAKGNELSQTSSVSREVVSARIDVDLMLFNTGDIPFTVSNIEVTVLQQSGNTGKFQPVATLISNSELISGTPLEVNLGAFTLERGPFLFASRDVFPNLVENLMRNPSGLLFRVANFDISDELGRNYAFANQTARDRTGGIVLDYGDAEAAERFLVATNGAMDPNNEAVSANGGGYVGGFSDVQGATIGLPINYVLQNILGMKRHDTAQDRIVPGKNGFLSSAGDNIKGDDVVEEIDGVDMLTAGLNGWLETRPQHDDFVVNPTATNGIIAGLNKTADSRAEGDDIQLVPVGTEDLSIGTVVIDPGENKKLDTPIIADDRVDFVGGYETSQSCSALSGKAGDICRIDSDCACSSADTEDPRCLIPPDPEADVIPDTEVGECSGPQMLVRVNSLRNGDYNRGWRILTTGTRPDAADFDLITVEPGADITLAFLQDLDKDGIFARNEFLLGSTDSSRDEAINADFGFSSDNPCPLDMPFCDGIPDSQDSDRDGLSDYSEAFVGWKVAADGGALRQVFSSPRFADTDGDGLDDVFERDLRSWCKIEDPRQDGLCAFQRAPAVLLSDAIGIIAGPNGVADTGKNEFGDIDLGGDDVQLVPFGNLAGMPLSYFGQPVIGAGPNCILETPPRGDDILVSESTIPVASDPSAKDTDLDGISDAEELNGYLVALALIDGGNGIAETTRNGDDIQRAFIDNPVFPGSVIILPGENGLIDSQTTSIIDPFGDDFLDIARREINCGINGTIDTVLLGDDRYSQYADASGNWEHSYGSLCDTSGRGAPIIYAGPDGVFDSIPNNTSFEAGDDKVREARLVTSDPLRRDTDSDLFSDGYEQKIGSDPTQMDSDDFVDSDQDGLTDVEENNLGWLVSVNGAVGFIVNPSPSLPDTDFDGLPDFVERDLRTNPNKADTDGDGLSDYDEVRDFSKYTALAALYPGLNIPVSNPSGYGTSPINSDTDGDFLSDYQELIDGFRLSIPGQPDAILVFTSPLQADTDLDGIRDANEIAGAFTVSWGTSQPTDPTRADTDSDGRNDFEEFIAGTNPFIDDRKITIRYSSLQLRGGKRDWDWEFRSQLSSELSPGTFMSDASDAGYTSSSSYCGTYAETGNLTSIGINKPRSMTMKKGDAITLHGKVSEFADCATQSGTDCAYSFRETFNYSDIVSGTTPASGVINTQVLAKGDDAICSAPDIIYDLIVN